MSLMMNFWNLMSVLKWWDCMSVWTLMVDFFFFWNFFLNQMLPDGIHLYTRRLSILNMYSFFQSSFNFILQGLIATLYKWSAMFESNVFSPGNNFLMSLHSYFRSWLVPPLYSLPQLHRVVYTQFLIMLSLGESRTLGLREISGFLSVMSSIPESGNVEMLLWFSYRR